MAVHELRLEDIPFHAIQKGIKKVEARLLDEKRQQIHIGDSIVFILRSDPDHSILTTVVGLFVYPSFNAMFKQLHQRYRSHHTREELEDSMLRYYSSEDEKKYGVIGIHIELA